MATRRILQNRGRSSTLDPGKEDMRHSEAAAQDTLGRSIAGIAVVAAVGRAASGSFVGRNRIGADRFRRICHHRSRFRCVEKE